MPKKKSWEFDGITVTAGHVRHWMQSVAHRIPARNWDHYITAWSVPEKIARAIEAGTFDQVVNQAAIDAGVTLRKRRRPNTIWRLRQAWPEAANDSQFVEVSHRPARRRDLENIKPAMPDPRIGARLLSGVIRRRNSAGIGCRNPCCTGLDNECHGLPVGWIGSAVGVFDDAELTIG